jgi:hypothetical protein
MASIVERAEAAGFSEQMCWAYQFKRFGDAPPKYPGLPYPWRWRKPVGECEDWRSSVYYYWWEYMRRNERYKLICEWQAVRDEVQLSTLTEFERQLYADFGDVHATAFREWWIEHYSLFCTGQIVMVTTDVTGEPVEEITMVHISGRMERMTIPRLFSKATAYHYVDEILIRYREVSAKYGAWGRYVLPTLQAHLNVWDAKLANPKAHDADIADIAGLAVEHGYDEAEIARMKAEGLVVKDLERAVRRAKQLAVQRHLRIARQYIDNLMTGWFPKRSKR